MNLSSLIFKFLFLSLDTSITNKIPVSLDALVAIQQGSDQGLE